MKLRPRTVVAAPAGDMAENPKSKRGTLSATARKRPQRGSESEVLRRSRGTTSPASEFLGSNLDSTGINVDSLKAILKSRTIDFSLKVDAAFKIAKLDLVSEYDHLLQPVFHRLFRNESSLERLCLQGLCSPHRIPQLMAIERLIKLLPVKFNEIDEITTSRVLPTLVKCYNYDDPQLQVQAACVLQDFALEALHLGWAFFNEQGLVQVFVHLLQNSTSDVLCNKAFSFLSLFVRTDQGARDYVSVECLEGLLAKSSKEPANSVFLRSVSSIISGLYKVHSEPPRPIPPGLCNFIFQQFENPDDRVVQNVCVALSAICLQEPHLATMAALFREGDGRRKLVKLLGNKSSSVVMHVLNIIVLSHTTDETEENSLIKVFCQDSALCILGNIITECHMDYGVDGWRKKELALSIIGCLCEKNLVTVRQLVEDPGVIPKVLKLIKKMKDFNIMTAYVNVELMYKAANAIKKAIEHCDNGELVEKGCIEGLCDMLACPCERIIKTCLEGLGKILKYGEADSHKTLGTYAVRFMRCGGYRKIQSLKTHSTHSSLGETFLNECWAGQH